MEAQKKVATAQNNKKRVPIIDRVTYWHTFAAFYVLCSVMAAGIGVAYLRSHTGLKDATIAAFGLAAIGIFVAWMFIYNSKTTKK